MTLNEEDVSVIRAERDATPRRYSTWDPNDEFYRRYHQLTPAQKAALNDQVTATKLEDDSADTESTSSASSSSSLELEAIRTARMSRTATNRINRSETHPEALSRIETHRTQHSVTVGGSRLKSRTSTKQAPLPEMGAGKPHPPQLPAKEEYVVEFEGVDDPLHAQNWPMRRKLLIGVILAFDALAATMGSSIFSAATRGVVETFHVGQEVATLGTSLFVLGYAFGPIMWAPLSELYGRRLPLIIAAFGFSIFAIATAVAKDLQTVMLGRFFGGFFGSCPLAVVAAAFADMFNNKDRGLAIAVFSATVFMGPLLAPFIGGFISISYLGWRWTEYISAIMGFSAFGLILIFFPETYPPIILVNKASELRRRTQNWGIHAKQEEIEVDFRELLTKNISRPMRILFTEPIVLLITLYMSFVYGLLYLFLTAYALVFQGQYKFNEGVAGLPYFGMVLGEIIAFIVVVITNRGYARKLEANNNIPVPEWRLPMAIAGAITFAAGLFWFGWTGFEGDKIPWIVPTLSGLFTGFGIFSIFLSLLNYLVDAYLMFAASALAGNTFMRSGFGAVFPLFATYMFDGMGIQWASTLLGCVALVLAPMPVVFLLYGKKIRAKSTFAPAPDIAQDKRRRQMKDAEANVDAAGNDPSNSNVEGSGHNGAEEKDD